ncbi:MAG: GTP-binding protein [Phycisphaerae bacterium]
MTAERVAGSPAVPRHHREASKDRRATARRASRRSAFDSTASSTSRYVMIGGFLGAGKTTAVARLAEHLTNRGLRVGLITNDQSTGLVDTALLRSRGFTVEEIAGGCFCCRFPSLLEAATRLTAATRPDVFVAEPVGSCTDLLATVSYPLRRIYGDRFRIAPLSVLVDPTRAARVFGLAAGRSLSSKVIYVYRKQLEEARFIVINKCDVVAEPLRQQLTECLQASFPRAEVFCCSAREGQGLAEWFARLHDDDTPGGPALGLDYDQYADGEALLGWLNATVRLSGGEPFCANELLLDLCEGIRRRLCERDCEIAHLKMTFEAEDGSGQLSVVSIVASDAEPDLRESLLDRVGEGTLIVNLRAEADPEALRAVTCSELERCVRSAGLRMELEHLDCFRPARPTPTHRDAATP